MDQAIVVRRSAIERLEVWRCSVTQGLTKVFFVVSLPGLVWLAVDSYRLDARQLIWVIGAFAISSLLCMLSSTPHRTRARWLIANLTLGALLCVPVVGLTAGVGSILTLSTLLAVLLLGLREAITALAVFVAGLLSWEGLILLHVADRQAPAVSDMGDPLSGLRASFASASLGFLALLASAYAIKQLLRTMFESERMLASKLLEAAAREDEAQRRRQAEDQLVRAQKVEALGRLAGGVAHDVNNNLTVSLSCADLIERSSPADERIHRLCAAIRDACGNASALTRQLLTLGRRDVPRPEFVSLSDCVRRIRPLLDSSVGKNVRLVVRVPDDLPPIHVDPRALEQVILNLVINAQDAMPQGGELTVSADSGQASPAYRVATADAAPERPVRIHVQDTGTGIAEDVLPQIMDPFFTTKEPDHGTGLGLAVARAFTESNGGRLGIETELGRGSTFTIELPAARPARTEQPLARAAARPRASATVLVVDDDARVREGIASELRNEGHRVIEAEDGRVALQRARDVEHIDLLCTDAAMPHIGGQELIRRFRVLHPSTPILVCCAYVKEQELRDLLRSGHYAALAKPFSPGDLRRAVEQALATPEARAPN